MRMTYSIQVTLVSDPDVSLSAHEVENLVRQAFVNLGIATWEVRVAKKIEPRSLDYTPGRRERN